ncbi:MAG: indolepyruvate ferredoxin oxidoreductase subunit alpha [Promethearchaeota archaeon]|nr:MAG: indolepyruvate ferredoxin oxidoreductase subunit alpha [Candidatus Lokiarchaeota archaeon]
MNVIELFQDKPGNKVLISGNEAFARGIFEAGVRFAANYPGTPISEVGDYLHILSKKKENFTFDYSINEKVALESCVGVSWTGLRSVVMFKHLGLNVAADPLHTFPYSGVNGGMLILCGGDPGILSSTNAQDNRLYALHTKIPIIEPSTVQECKDFVKEGLRLSELYKIPIYLHVTSRLCHSHGIVTLGEVVSTENTRTFKKDPDRYVNTLNRALSNQSKYFKTVGKVAKNRKLFYLFNRVKDWKNNGVIKPYSGVGIITSGICYSYVIQACRRLNIEPPILKLGLIFPINRNEICNFANKYNLKKILVVEELEAFIETVSKRTFCNYCDSKRDLEIHGKDFIPKIGELTTDIVIRFLYKHFDVKRDDLIADIERKEEILKEVLPILPTREPTFCPGCQYRPVFYSLKKAVENLTKEKGFEFIYAGDIGCYTLSESYPYQMLDWVVCMGAGIGIANGMAHVVPDHQKLIAFIGDSTLFHAGLQPLLNAIKKDTDMTIIVFNNYWTSMTGQQQHIGTPLALIKNQKTELKRTEIDILSLLRNIGLKENNLIVTRAYNMEHLERIFLKTLPKKGTKVIVINEECALEKDRRLRLAEKNDENSSQKQTYYTILDSCVKCNECIEFLGCPAINIEIVKTIPSDSDDELKPEDYKYFINQSACMPNICPGLCKAVCKDNMIKKTIISSINHKSSSK